MNRSNPFPGLRPFEYSDAHVFFGRERQVDELIDKLVSSRFLAVVGPSGCGKSSLVRAGLFPALQSGRFPGKTEWDIVTLRPGTDPVGNLSRSLALSGIYFEENRPAAPVSVTGDFAAIGTHEGTIRLLKLSDLRTLKQEREWQAVEDGEEILEGGTAPVIALAISTDSRHAAWIDSEGTCYIVNLSARERKHSAVVTAGLRSISKLQFLHTGELLIAEDGKLTLWEVSENTSFVEIMTEEGLGTCSALVSRESPLEIVWCNVEGDIWSICPETEKRLLHRAEEYVGAALFDKSGGITFGTDSGEVWKIADNLAPTRLASDLGCILQFWEFGGALHAITDEGVYRLFPLLPPALLLSERLREAHFFDADGIFLGTGLEGGIGLFRFDGNKWVASERLLSDSRATSPCVAYCDGVVAATLESGESYVWWIDGHELTNNVVLSGPQDALSIGLESMLRQSKNALLKIASATQTGSKPVLIFVDQFEEIFRFSRGLNEAEDFLQLLLEPLFHQTSVASKIYILLTMRTDFLGDCHQFRRLPEALSTGQYLVPRLEWDQLHQIITEPLRLRGRTIKPELVNVLLNQHSSRRTAEGDFDRADQLPVLQHTLARLWSFSLKTEPPAEFTCQLYDKTLRLPGLLGDAATPLEAHLEEVLHSGLPEKAIKAVFQRLTMFDPRGRGIRRPCEYQELLKISDDVPLVTHRLRRPDCSFLMPPTSEDLRQDTKIDISHEAVIRQWPTLVEWMAEEVRNAKTLERLRVRRREAAELKGTYIREPELSAFESWWENTKPTSAWAERYLEGRETLSEIHRHLKLSRTQENRERGRERRNIIMLCIGCTLLISLAIFLPYKLAENETRAAREATDGLTVLNLAREAEKAAQDGLPAVGLLLAATATDGALALELDEDEKQSVLNSRSADERSDQVELRNHEALVALYANLLSGDISLPFDDVELQESIDIGRDQVAHTGRHVFLHSENRLFVWDVQDFFPTLGDAIILKGDVVEVQFDIEEELVGSQTSDGTVSIFDADLNEVKQFKNVQSFAFAPSTDHLAVALRDRIEVWQAPRTESSKTIKIESDEYIRTMRISEDGQKLPALGNESLHLWNLGTGRKIAQAPLAWSSLLATSSDLSSLVIRKHDGTGFVARVDENVHIEAEMPRIDKAQFFFDDQQLLIESAQKLKRYSLTPSGSNLVIKESSQPLSGRNGLFSPDGNILVTDTGMSFLVWSVAEDGHLRWSHRERKVNSEKAIALSLNGSTLVYQACDRKLRLRRRESRAFERRTLNCKTVLLSPNGELLVTAQKDGTVSLTDLAQEDTPARSWSSDSPEFLKFSPNSKMLAVGDTNGKIEIFSLAEWKPDPRTELTGISYNNRRIFLSDDGKLLDSPVCRFSHDGKLLDSGGGPPKLWGPDGKLIQITDSEDWKGAKLSPDGLWLAYLSPGQGTQLYSIGDNTSQGLTEQEKSFEDLTFSTNRNLAFVAKDSSKITLRSLEDSQVRKLPIEGEPTFIRFSVDGNSLAVGTNSAVFVWSLEIDSAQLEQRVLRLDGVADAIPSSSGDFLATSQGGWGTTLWDVVTTPAEVLVTSNVPLENTRFRADANRVDYPDFVLTAPSQDNEDEDTWAIESWSLGLEELAVLVRKCAGRDFTESEFKDYGLHKWVRLMLDKNQEVNSTAALAGFVSYARTNKLSGSANEALVKNAIDQVFERDPGSSFARMHRAFFGFSNNPNEARETLRNFPDIPKLFQLFRDDEDFLNFLSDNSDLLKPSPETLEFLIYSDEVSARHQQRFLAKIAQRVWKEHPQEQEGLAIRLADFRAGSVSAELCDAVKIESEESRAIALNALAWAIAISDTVTKSQVETGIEAVKESLKLKPSADSENTLATLYYRLGDYKSAVEWGRRALEQSNNAIHGTNLVRFLEKQNGRDYRSASLSADKRLLFTQRDPETAIQGYFLVLHKQKKIGLIKVNLVRGSTPDRLNLEDLLKGVDSWDRIDRLLVDSQCDGAKESIDDKIFLRIDPEVLDYPGPI